MYAFKSMYALQLSWLDIFDSKAGQLYVGQGECMAIKINMIAIYLKKIIQVFIFGIQIYLF